MVRESSHSNTASKQWMVMKSLRGDTVSEQQMARESSDSDTASIQWIVRESSHGDTVSVQQIVNLVVTRETACAYSSKRVFKDSVKVNR
jgi:hypothetical protein